MNYRLIESLGETDSSAYLGGKSALSYECRAINVHRRCRYCRSSPGGALKLKTIHVGPSGRIIVIGLARASGQQKEILEFKAVRLVRASGWREEVLEFKKRGELRGRQV